MLETRRHPTGHTQLAVSAVAVAPTVPPGSNFALIRCTSGGPVRWRDDAAPDATHGMQLKAGETLEYDGACTALQFIRDTGGVDATLDIAFYA